MRKLVYGKINKNENRQYGMNISYSWIKGTLRVSFRS